MAVKKAEKVVLQRAATDTYSKAGAEMKAAEWPLAKAKANSGTPDQAEQSADNGRKPR